MTSSKKVPRESARAWQMGVIFSQFTIPPPKHFLQASASPQSSLHLLQVNENGIIKRGKACVSLAWWGYVTALQIWPWSLKEGETGMKSKSELGLKASFWTETILRSAQQHHSPSAALPHLKQAQVMSGTIIAKWHLRYWWLWNQAKYKFCCQLQVMWTWAT